MRGLENRKEQTRQTRKSPAHSRHNAELHTQKKRCSISCGALLHAHLSGFQARPLNFQRRKKVTDSPSHPATARARRKNLLESESVSDHSHKAWSAVRPPSPIPVGAELARDSGGSACIYAECTAAFASRLAPTIGLSTPARAGRLSGRLASKLCSHRSSSNKSDGCTPPARARPAIRPPRGGR
ncbi:hypothetical protein SAMN03159290_01345 [Pseudomonas sp. NFACC13-1]|nr:hypothetical protein SAMN03159290_01345 [Pseudomonas sp. NFACC13-1]